MPTEDGIKAEYKILHDSLTYQYYQLKETTKEEFDYLHGKCWNDMYTELIANGFLSEPVPRPEPFEPLNPVMGVEQRLSHVEEFLRGK